MNRAYRKHLLEFSQRVKSMRKSKGITQVELSAAMDVDVRTIKNLESGNYNPTLLTMLALADALDVELSELV